MANKRKEKSKDKNTVPLRVRIYHYRWFYFMFLPVFISILIFSYLPMFGIVYSFTEYTPFTKVPKFIGLENFKVLFEGKMFWRAFFNTLQISSVNLILSIVCSVGLALLVDEVSQVHFRKITQTIIYIPHFISWVVVAAIFTMVLSPKNGIVNAGIELFGGEPIYFLTSDKWWRPIFFIINRWKETGWGTIIFIAALAGVDMEQYEAARIDGAGHIQRIIYITLPSIAGTILVVFVLNLAKILNLFDSVWVLQNSMTTGVSDVIGTYVYRIGITSADYGLSTAAGLFKSVVSVVLVTMANKASKKIKGEGIL
ncbi:protein LplB [Anaerocolumna cellulosilytica]|uniref:Protein LplB n=1 Tax=Anaerocolumna cellulosilytica TaxID=433286 RepID=A0A6S6R377_9FIRM|nr:ABC transporter permease subunit [Anaerocolumna cellulosilytica]MBB5196700.1 putative aldouronate transport system permease protein [Anaerocolumna cellulosilytica]BCJ93962.1 protein LplB [Anaerocolumna cellulosilytica]